MDYAHTFCLRDKILILLLLRILLYFRAHAVSRISFIRISVFSGLLFIVSFLRNNVLHAI